VVGPLPTTAGEGPSLLLEQPSQCSSDCSRGTHARAHTHTHAHTCKRTHACTHTHAHAGPSGSSVREIMRQSECDIKSWTEPPNVHSRRPSRTFVIEGPDHAVGHAIDIITAAVDRYKELCEGRCQGGCACVYCGEVGVELSACIRACLGRRPGMGKGQEGMEDRSGVCFYGSVGGYTCVHTALRAGRRGYY